MPDQDPQTYPVAIDATPEQLSYLATSGAEPQGTVTFNMTQQQYQHLPGASDIRDKITFRRELSDGLSFSMNLQDAAPLLYELLDHYNNENPQATYDRPWPLETLTSLETLKLIRTVALTVDLDFQINPGANGATVTQVMREQELQPRSIFARDQQEPA